MGACFMHPWRPSIVPPCSVPLRPAASPLSSLWRSPAALQPWARAISPPPALAYPPFAAPAELSRIPTLLYGTINGVIGVVASLPQQMYTFLDSLQVSRWKQARVLVQRGWTLQLCSCVC